MLNKYHYIYSNYIYSNYIYSNYIYSNYIYSNYIYSNYIIQNKTIYENTYILFFKHINLQSKLNFIKYKRQLKYNSITGTNIFISLVNIFIKSGLKFKLYLLFNKYYNFYLFYNNIFLTKILLFYQNIIFNLKELMPINSLLLNKINKKKKKNARIKNKYEKQIQYLTPKKRLNFVLKWLKLDLICAEQHSIHTRIFFLLNKILIPTHFKTLLIYGLKKKLHLTLLAQFLKKKNK